MIQVGNAPCSWGVLEFDTAGEAAGYTQVLDEIKETGYHGTELGDWGFMPTDPGRLKNEIHSRGLTLLGAFVPVPLRLASSHEAGEQIAVRTARLLCGVEGTRPFIVLADDNGTVPVRAKNAGRITPEMGLSEAEWHTFAAGATRIAQAIKHETGLRTVFHHHCGGFVETPQEIDKLMSLTDGDLLGLCFDTGHYRFGGGDPVQGLRQYGKRVWHFHFKDYQPEVGQHAAAEGWDYLTSVRHGIFCELGQGAVNFPAVLQELDKLGYAGWGVVEQDVLPGMGKPKESASRNREYLRKLGL